MTERELFVAALERTDPGKRAAFLDEACIGDRELRAQVAALLVEHEHLGNFLESPVDPTNSPRLDPAGNVVLGSMIGPYRLLQAIGEGGMGTVYLAEQEQPVRRRVALKIIKPGLDSAQIIARFEAERQALALMDHQNIARFLDVGTTATGRPFFVMELVNGVAITEYCDQNRLAPRERLDLFVPICHAIQHAHQKGIIHRDIKPSNVLVAIQDGKPVPKVIDFGVAKAIDQHMTVRSISTVHGQVVGTLEYMSPEQAKRSGVDVDTRSDIYSLGVLAYELLTGSTPLQRKALSGAAYLEILRMIREEDPPTPSTRLSDSGDGLASIASQRKMEPAMLTRLVRGDLDWIVMKALDKDRTRRYDTASSLARDVERYLADEPVEARPPSARYRLGKFLRRNKGPVLAATLVLLALVGGIVGTTWGMVQAENAWREESEQRRIAQTKEAEAVAAQARAEAATLQESAARASEAKQRQRAEVNEKRAIAEKRIAEAMRAFLQNDLLLQADPIQQAHAVRRLSDGFETKANPTIKDLLERAAAELTPEKIEGKLPGRKEVQAEILRTVGQAYYGIGEYEKAAEFLTRARGIFLTVNGPNSRETLATSDDLGEVYRVLGKLPQAIELLESVRDGWAKHYTADDRAALATQNTLALAYLEAGQAPRAVKLLEQVRNSATKILALDDPFVFRVMNNLAAAYYKARRLFEAIELREQIQGAVVKKFGADHPHTLTAMSNLALLYQDAGKLPRAIELLEKVRSVELKSHGADHPKYLLTLSNLGVAYRDARMLPQAIGLLEQVRFWRVKKLGLEHPSTLNVFANLGRAYQYAGQSDKGIALMRQAALGAEKVQFRHVNAEAIVGHLIACHEQLQQYEEAAPWRRKWLAVVKERDGADSPGYASELPALGRNLLKQKKWAEAENVLRECVARFEKLTDVSVASVYNVPPAPEWAVFNMKSILGEAILGQERYADAETLLLAGYEGMKQREATIPPQGKARLTEAGQRLVQLYDVWGKYDQAALWRMKLKQPNLTK